MAEWDEDSHEMALWLLGEARQQWADIEQHTAELREKLTGLGSIALGASGLMAAVAAIGSLQSTWLAAAIIGWFVTASIGLVGLWPKDAHNPGAVNEWFRVLLGDGAGRTRAELLKRFVHLQGESITANKGWAWATFWAYVALWIGVVSAFLAALFGGAA